LLLHFSECYCDRFGSVFCQEREHGLTKAGIPDARHADDRGAVSQGAACECMSPAETGDNISFAQAHGGPSDDVSEVHKKSGQVLLGLVLTNLVVNFRSNASIGTGRLEA
jgi:hypothetical protein